MGKGTWNVFELRKLLEIVWRSSADVLSRSQCVGHRTLRVFQQHRKYYNHEVTPEMEARADEILEFLEISYLAARLMCELSTGEARRVLIRRALVHNPQALILDEPANSLDLKAMHSFRKSVQKIASSGRALF